MPVIDVISGGPEENAEPIPEVSMEVETEEVETTEEVQEEVTAETEEQPEGYTFAESAPQESEKTQDNSVIRELRQRYRESEKRRKELEEQVAQATPKPVSMPKPTLESCDFDADVFEQKLTSWYDQKRQIEAQEQEVKKAQEAKQQEWQARLSQYEQDKLSLNLPGIDEAEDMVKALLSEEQQAVLIHIAEKPLKLVSALGRHPSKLKELSGEKDLLKLAVKIRDLEKETVTVKKTAPPPEKVVKSVAPVSSGAVNKQLDALRTEAARTGDYSKVVQFRRTHNLA